LSSTGWFGVLAVQYDSQVINVMDCSDSVR
jgi:hypothetical protein